MQRDHEDQEALSKMTKERDAQSALVAKQRHLLAAKQSEITKIEAERDALKREVERLQGIKPELPPREGRGEGLPRYGLRWNGLDQPVATPMEDGFWVPWHLAQQEVEALRRKCVLDGEKLEALGRMYEGAQHKVESLRAKLASRTVEWPEWAKEGVLVQIRFKRHTSSHPVGTQFRITSVDKDRWCAYGGKLHAAIPDLEPVAEHTQPAVAVQS